MLGRLTRGGAAVEAIQDEEYGRFSWSTDPEGNRFELFEPRDDLGLIADPAEPAR